MRKTTEERMKAIEDFRSTPKFRCIEPEFKMLNPSPDSVTLQARTVLHECADEMMTALELGAGNGQIRESIKKHLSRVDKAGLDTEDREYVAYYFHGLGDLAEVNVSFLVNRWLYGFPIALVSRFFGKR